MENGVVTEIRPKIVSDSVVDRLRRTTSKKRKEMIVQGSREWPTIYCHCRRENERRRGKGNTEVEKEIPIEVERWKKHTRREREDLERERERDSKTHSLKPNQNVEPRCV